MQVLRVKKVLLRRVLRRRLVRASIGGQGVLEGFLEEGGCHGRRLEGVSKAETRISAEHNPLLPAHYSSRYRYEDLIPHGNGVVTGQGDVRRT